MPCRLELLVWTCPITVNGEPVRVVENTAALAVPDLPTSRWQSGMPEQADTGEAGIDPEPGWP